jgi:hypothetical protein
MNRPLVSLAIATALLTSCEPPVATAKFTTWGEEYIEDGLPAQMGSTTGFVDGWSVKYSKFLIVFKDLTVADAAGKVVTKLGGAKAYDLTKKGPVELLSASVASGKYEQVSYVIAPDANVAAGNLDAADLELLKTRNASLIVLGTATKGSTMKTFEWTFALDTLYQDCEKAEMGGKGVVLPVGTTTTTQLTVHGDHFFYDDLQSPTTKLRFQAIADADTNADGKVTLEELALVQLTSLPAGQYGTGSVANVKNLREFVTDLSRTVGHYDGEGECLPKAR